MITFIYLYINYNIIGKLNSVYKPILFANKELFKT